MTNQPQLKRANPHHAARVLLLLLIIGFPSAPGAQSVTSLSAVKTICIDTFSGGADAAHLRESMVRQLSKSRRFQLVQSAKDADAVIKGKGEIWVRGSIAINPRTPATDRQAVYNGYLSLEVVRADGQPLWSWLVTPGKLSWSNIVDTLAGSAVRKLIEASESSAATSSVPFSSGVLAKTEITGGGATFPAPLYQKWLEDFAQLHPGVQVRYSAIGSQIGIESLVAGKLDFAGSDVAPELVMSQEPASHLLRFASVLGAVVPIYNLKGVTRDLRFTPETLADIYLGRVRRWDDPEIRRSNSGVNLPDEEIAVIHRSDGSGTTWVWSDFLSKISAPWSSSIGRGTTLRWPVGSGAEGSEGVAEAVQNTANSIGYVELAYAIQHRLSFAAVRNRSGEFLRADLDSLAEAAKGSAAPSEPNPSITDPPGKNAYPIAAYTWIVIPADTADPAQSAAVRELLRWILTSGQKECSALGYVPLPRDIADSQVRTLDGVRK